MKPKPLIYLASPYSHPSADVQDYRFRVVCRVAARLMREGHLIFSPIAHSHSIATLGLLPHDFRFWGEFDKAMLKRCDALWILMLNGWLESRGILEEYEYFKNQTLKRQRDAEIVNIDPLPEELEAKYQ